MQFLESWSFHPLERFKHRLRGSLSPCGGGLALSNIGKSNYNLAIQEKTMKSMNIGAIAAVAAILCATPVSLRLSQGNSVSSFPLTAVSTSAEAAELSLPARHYHAARYRH